MKFAIVIPFLFLSVFIYACIKKVKLYDCFAKGVKQAFPLVVSVFPYIATMFLLTELFEQSGLSSLLSKTVAPFFNFLGIPEGLEKLVFVKPFSGSGAMTLLTEVFKNYGPDSYTARCAAVCYGSSETTFYIAAIYFANVKRKKITLAIFISLLCAFISLIFSCFLCRFM